MFINKLNKHREAVKISAPILGNTSQTKVKNLLIFPMKKPSLFGQQISIYEIQDLNPDKHFNP